jgi:REP element-mobilizing transposase RayT
MPRKLRVEYPGAIYDVMNRGDHRENIFRDDQDRDCFLSTLGEACRKTEWAVLAYCLMPNHFHLVIETPQANLIAGMKWMLGVYTKRFNIRHKLCGHLFAGRYKALVVEGSGNGYLATVCDYVGPRGTQDEQERRGAEGGIGPPSARRNDDDAGLDSPAPENGQLGPRFKPPERKRKKCKYLGLTPGLDEL